MKKIAILLAATMAFAINSNAQSMQSGYKGHVEAGYSVGIGDYDFGRFEVNTTHGYQVNPYIFLGAGTGLHFILCLLTKQVIWKYHLMLEIVK